MQITDEAVEAAAREFYRALSFDSVGPPVRDRWMASARAALEAALPHLLACQRSGAGHSADALAPDVVRLVIAARHVAFDGAPPGLDADELAALEELDRASEAFADRVPWEDDPTKDGEA